MSIEVIVDEAIYIFCSMQWAIISAGRKDEERFDLREESKENFFALPPEEKDACI